MGEKSKPCKGGTYNTAERGWFADAVKWTVMVRRVVVKPEKYLKRGLHKADEQITFVKFELGCTRSSLSLPYSDPVGSFSVMASWCRGVSVPHVLTPCVVYACTGVALMPGSHWCCWHSTALWSSGVVRWLLGTVAKQSWKSVLTSYVIHAVFLK